jgi:hypothetical protein
LLQSYGEYFEKLSQAYLSGTAGSAKEMEGVRQVSRVARSNFEGSIDRVASEPGTTEQQLTQLNAIRASSHRFVHAIMAMDAGWLQTTQVPTRPPFKIFAADVKKTISQLVAASRGARVQESDFPNLRADHNQLIEYGGADTERYALVNVEADRITNSLNTLREQIMEWLASTHPK